MFIIKSKKGFNLFTALVSLMLIAITLILIFNMVKTEDNYLKIIEEQSSNSDTITVIDLVRADAFNLFVVGLRENWETYKSSPNNFTTINRKYLDMNWDTFVKEISQDLFYESDKFPDFLAQNIYNQLMYTPDPIGYQVSVSTDSDFKDIIAKMFEDTNYNFDIVNCEQNSNECLGSMYMSMTTLKLSDSNYQKLPRVTVKNLKTNEVIQKPIFSKRDYKIYLPWRGFQSFRVARRIATTYDREISSNPANYHTDNSLFSPKLHNTLEQARLGVCDRGTCAPRKDLFITPSKNGFSDTCNSGEFIINNVGANNSSGITVGNTQVTLSNNYDYGLGEYNDVKIIFEDLVETTTENNLVNREINTIMFDENMAMSGRDYLVRNNSNYVKIEDISVNIASKVTKQVGEVVQDSSSLDDYSFKNDEFNPDSSWNTAWAPGLFYNSDDKKAVIPIENSISISQNNNDNSKLECFEITEIKYKLHFIDNNPRYSMGEDPMETYVYLEDDYLSFVFNLSILDNLFNNSVLNNNGYFENLYPFNNQYNQDTLIRELNDWICYSYEGGDDPNNKSCNTTSPS